MRQCTESCQQFTAWKNYQKDSDSSLLYVQWSSTSTIFMQDPSTPQGLWMMYTISEPVCCLTMLQRCFIQAESAKQTCGGRKGINKTLCISYITALLPVKTILGSRLKLNSSALDVTSSYRQLMDTDSCVLEDRSNQIFIFWICVETDLWRLL